MFDHHPLALLCQSHRERDQQCNCGHTGFCPAHGSYEPAVTDPEVLNAVNESAARRGGVRVIRKRLEN